MSRRERAWRELAVLLDRKGCTGYLEGFEYKALEAAQGWLDKCVVRDCVK